MVDEHLAPSRPCRLLLWPRCRSTLHLPPTWPASGIGWRPTPNVRLIVRCPMSRPVRSSLLTVDSCLLQSDGPIVGILHSYYIYLCAQGSWEQQYHSETYNIPAQETTSNHGFLHVYAQHSTRMAPLSPFLSPHQGPSVLAYGFYRVRLAPR